MYRSLHIFLSIATLVFTMNSLAQAVPQDEEKNEEQQKEEKAKLNLPDVIIYGQDKNVRDAGRKLKTSAEKPSLLDLDKRYQSLATKTGLDDSKLLSMGSAPEFKSTTSIDIRYGSFNSPVVEINRAHEFEKFDYRLSGLLRHTDGQYENSQFTNGQLTAHAGANLSPNVSVAVNGGYYKSNYGLYGAITDNLQRDVDGGSAKIRAHWDISSLYNADFELSFRKYMFDLDDAANFESTEEDVVGINFSLQRSIQQAQLSMGIQFLNNRNSLPNGDYDYFKLGLLMNYPLGKLFSINPSLTVERLANLTAKVAPGIEVVFTPTTQLGFSVRAERYYVPYSVFDLWSINPYFNPSIAMPAHDVTLDLELKSEYRLLTWLAINGHIGQKWVTNYSYWLNEPASNMFLLDQFDEVTVAEIGLGTVLTIADRFDISAHVRYFIDELGDDFPAADRAAIPYFSKIRIPIHLQYKITDTIILSANSTWLDQRRISVVTTEKLESYFLASMKIEKRFFNGFLCYASANNLLDTEFETWEHYPHPGIQVFLGAAAKW